ncbi:MAG: two-component regulator propeller domain-containing protein [Candidatus Marinimicrobia bacterium]|nr:two-component regulator propeller domain-containing protein [Candidatus Neomarinimicrobiota bacterium]
MVRLSLLILILFISANATNNSLKFDHLTVEDGLSQGSVYSILQDDKGFMWFGTRFGLNRYDGTEFRLFASEPTDSTSLAGYHITKVYKDHQGSLWVGTAISGLAKYDAALESFTNFKHDPRDPRSLGDDQITCIFEDSEYTLWVGTKNGLNRVVVPASGSRSDPFAYEFDHFSHIPGDTSSLSSNDITAISELHAGILLIGLGNGSLATLDINTDQIKIDQAGVFTITKTGYTPIRSMKRDVSGEYVWISKFEQGLIKYSLSEGVLDHYYISNYTPAMVSTNYIYTIDQARDGKLWLATVGGLTVFDPASETFTYNNSDESNPSSISDQILHTVSVDPQGLIWVGSDTRGINIHKPNQIRFELFRHRAGDPNGPSANNVYCLAEGDAGDIWFTTMPGGTNRFSPKTGKFRYYQSDDSIPGVMSINYPIQVLMDRRGILWVGTVLAGLSEIDPETGSRLKLYYNDESRSDWLSGPTIYSLLESSDGSIWIGTEANGLNRYNRRSNNFTTYRLDKDDPNSLSGNLIYVLFEDDAGVLWIGTAEGGLNRYHPETDTFSSFKYSKGDENSIGSNSVYTIHEDADHCLWIGTKGGGLNKLDSTRRFFSRVDLGYKDHDISIYGIEEDDGGYLWLSTNNGLMKVDREKGFLNRYTVKDGLQGNEFRNNSSLKDSQGYLYFGGPSGFNRFHPDSVINNAHVPPVVLTNFSINYNEVPVGEMSDGRTILSKSITETRQIVLNHQDKTISFSFAALDFSDPERNRYEYKLKNFNDDWVQAGSDHSVTYNHLKPGDYAFQVRACNNDGLWNEEGATLAITILPPFWLTWWFRLLTSLTLILFVYVYIRLRFRRMMAEKHKLEKLVMERTAELRLEIEEKMQIKVDHLKRELVSKSVYATQKQEIMNNLFHELKDIQKMDANEMRNRFNRIVRYFKDLFKSGEEWDEFEKWFTEVHTDFFTNIRKEHPELSSREVKVCALLRLDLSSKDIANLMNVLPKTVEMYRHRIRKKIGIKPETNLNQFLAKF